MHHEHQTDSSGQKVRTNQSIQIRGARVNNLKNIDISIPRNKLTVITGLSGSGKSSLAFDTLYAEGQRRFVESLSAYARQFLDRLHKPDVDSIIGLPPAVAIEQQTFSRNPRSTVGTTTEIYDYLRLLYGRIGIVLDKDTGEIVRKDNPQSVTDHILSHHRNARMLILAPMPNNMAITKETLEALLQAGFTRLIVGDSIEPIHITPETTFPNDATEAYILIDRVVVSQEAETVSRITDSLETAFQFGDNAVVIRYLDDGQTGIQPWQDKYFSARFEHARTKTQYIEPEPRLFSFNNPFGACATCQGFGRSVGIDENLVFPDKSLSLKKGAIHPFRGDTFGVHLKMLLAEAPAAGIPVNDPVYTFTDDQMTKVMEGFGRYIGVLGFFRMLEEKTYKPHYRVILSRYRGYTKCRACDGSRLRTAARQVYVGGKNIPEIVNMTLAEVLEHFRNLTLSEHDQKVVGLVVQELVRRLQLLCDIGLEYLTLDRLSHTLSGGESQRINLATSLGSSLVGTLYVLDEPSVGLHPRDTARLIGILRQLRNLGNTVVVVEHDPDVIRAADHIIDVGPGAGEHGGEIVFEGTPTNLEASGTTLTADYLNGTRTVRAPRAVRKGSGKNLIVRKPLHNNLKGDDFFLPLGQLTVVTGVSGSGKSSLVHDVVYAGIKRIYGGYTGEVGNCERIEGLAGITGVEMVDQTPLGRSSRSTPATYTKVFDAIREVFASTQMARQMAWKPGHFSFNVAGGRCEVCEGEGRVTIEMQFLPDIELPCEVCGGTRYKREVLQVLYRGKNIVDVLSMTVTEALEHFSDVPKVRQRLTVLKDVGLGYIRLGQPASRLSGGEAQRVKLASFLDTSAGDHVLFIFDEPTTGLHLHDISFLLKAFDSLVDKGHTVLIIEHNIHVIAAADHIVDMGPGGGKNGGSIVATGTPKQLAKMPKSLTGQVLREYFAKPIEALPLSA